MMKSPWLLAALAVFAGCSDSEVGPDLTEGTTAASGERYLPELVGEEVAVLTAPPNVPPPITRDHATKVIVELEVIEAVGELSPGTQYTFWTFGGTVPGSFIRVRQGDMVEFHLRNHPDNKVPHNIDLHAVTGPGGGAEASLTMPGHETVFSFRTLNPGLYVYHCATAPVGMHIANGMYGLILVEPPEGLPPVDREYYLMQSEFYTAGRYGAPGHQPFDMDKALAEIPEYVVFNGSVGAASGDSALHASVGENIRLYIGNGGPNLVSSFHAIGEIFDSVRIEGGSLVNKNVQTTLIPAGGATVVDFRVDVPGELVLVDHSIFRAFNKGAIATIDVSGEEDLAVYTGQQRDVVYKLEGGVSQSMPGTAEPEQVTYTTEERIAHGKDVYGQVCAACHLPNGQGVPGAFPPLAGADYLNEDVLRATRGVVHGMQGEVVVNGVTYNNVMPRPALTASEVANVLTYVYAQWDNNGSVVDEALVQKAIEAGPLPVVGAQ